MPRHIDNKQELVSQANDRLRFVLNKYYRVQGKSFDDCTVIEICKHQMLHLAKLTKKLMLHVFEQTHESKRIVVNEVAPDVVIYLQELIFKYELETWRGLTIPDTDVSQRLGFLLDREEKFSSLSDTLIAVCRATAALADICDQADHGQKSQFGVEMDVVKPMLRVAATLTAILELDIDTLYKNRLQQMKEKYERWS